MKLNPKQILFGHDEEEKRPVLLAVTPPRTGERTLLGVENLLQSIAVPEPFSLELAGDMDGVSLMARCLDDEVVRGQLSAHYPQARIRTVTGDEDPLRLEEGEQAWSITLRADAPEYVPLRTFRDDDLLDPGSDPLIALMGALSELEDGERVVARLMLRSLGPDWSQPHLEKAHKMPGMEPREPAYTFQTKPLQMDGLTMAALGIGALAALKGYLWIQDGEIWKAALLGVGTALGLAAGGWAWWRWKKARKRVEDPILIREKVSRIAFDAELHIVAVLPDDTRPQRARELLGAVAAAYRHFDNPAGARFKIGSVRPDVPDPDMLHPPGPGLFGRRSVLGVREVACLWHPPGAGDETPLVERSGARALLPSAKGVRGGAPVGDTTAGKPRPIRFPEDLLRRHHLYVARTRMGKSTPHAPRHNAQDAGEGRGQGRRRHRRRRSPRRPRGRAASAGPRVPHRQGAPHRPGGPETGAGHQSAGHPHLRRPRPHRRLRGARRQGAVGAVGAEDAVHPRTDRQDPPRGERAPRDRRGQPAHHPRRAEAPLRQEVPGRRAQESRGPLPP